jgi:hypothetical protein
MDGTEDHHHKQNKWDQEIKILHVPLHMQNLDLKKNKNGMCIKFALLGDENQVSVLREKRGKGGWIWLKYFIHIYYYRLIKPFKLFLRERIRKSNMWVGVGEIVSYICMEISEWNLCV